MANHRIDKINEEIARELSRLLRSMKDPRMQGVVSVVRVETTSDLRHAKVFVSALSEQEDGVFEALKSASGFLRPEIAASVDLRYTPVLHFVRDESMRRGARILDILESIDIPEDTAGEDTPARDEQE